MIALLTALAICVQNPVPMTVREIGPPTSIQGGRVATLKNGELEATLFVPDGWKPSNPSGLWMHFHTAPWFIVSEYQRAGVKEPVLVFNFGQGSTVYAKPFEKPGSLRPWIELAEKELGTRVDSFNLTSFSAGYGAVRNLVQEPEVLAKIRTVILADSMYGSLESQTPRVVLKDHVDCWSGLLAKAVSGEATWIVATTQITPESYAGTWEVAKVLVASTGGEMQDATGSEEASSTEPYRLLRTYRKGRFVVWSYSGEDAMAHMTIPRHLAELIQASREVK